MDTMKGRTRRQFRWFFIRPIIGEIQYTLGVIMSAIADIAAKLSTDVDSVVAALAAKDATILDLQTQLAAEKANSADTDAAVAVLTAADAKLNPPADPTP